MRLTKPFTDAVRAELIRHNQTAHLDPYEIDILDEGAKEELPAKLVASRIREKRRREFNAPELYPARRVK